MAKSAYGKCMSRHLKGRRGNQRSKMKRAAKECAPLLVKAIARGNPRVRRMLKRGA